MLLGSETKIAAIFFRLDCSPISEDGRGVRFESEMKMGEICRVCPGNPGDSQKIREI